MKQPSTSFFEQQLLPLGITDDNNKVTIRNPLAEHPMPKTYEAKIFNEDQEGNIDILYWTLDRELIMWDRDDRKNHNFRTYTVKRLKEPDGDRKYIMPEGGSGVIKEYGSSTFAWYAPEICTAYDKKEKIETVFLTEGVKKGWMGCKCGMMTIGLSSITHYAQKNGELYADLQRLIIECQIENIVVLWDGDCLDVSKNALDRREDLVKRPLLFYSSAKKIREKIAAIKYPEGHQVPAVYFYHIIPESFKALMPKGLDDLLVAAKASDDVKAVVKHAHELTKPSPYFKKFDITDTRKVLYEYFALRDADKFYKRHAHIIKGYEFRYNGDLMKYDESKEELKLLAPSWAKELRWIGNEYFLETMEPSVKGMTRKVLKDFTQGNLEKMYQKGFWKYLNHFIGFCNIPSHWDYRQVIELNGKEFYNRYFPFRWTAKPGKWETIEGFLKHIFGEEEVTHELSGDKIPRWHLALDYIQLILNNPTQMLPVLILFSPENNTGKSTFGRLLAAIFGDNVVPIGNSDLQSDFNETYSDKLLAICEETLLDRKKDVERIKALSTNPRILVNPKNMRQFQIDFFCKFIFMSNNTRMIYVTRHDQRFWIIKVPQFKKEIPNMMDLMEAEIPAFIHHLKDRKMATAHESRMYFHPSLLKTDAFEETVRINEPSAASDLRQRIGDMFLHDKDLDRIEMPLGEIRDLFFSGKTSDGWIREILRDYLLVEQLINEKGKPKLKRGFYHLWEKNNEGQLTKKTIHWRGRPYVFLRKDFVGEEDQGDYEEIAEVEAQLARQASNGQTAEVPAKKLTEQPEDDLPF